MTNKSKNYTSIFKFKVALEASKEERTLNQIGAEHQVPPSCISEWKKQLLKEGSRIFQTKKIIQVPEAHEDVEYLQKEIGKLTVQLDWLKKKHRIID